MPSRKIFVKITCAISLLQLRIAPKLKDALVFLISFAICLERFYSRRLIKTA